jgi:hypothetical protein
MKTDLLGGRHRSAFPGAGLGLAHLHHSPGPHGERDEQMALT